MREMGVERADPTFRVKEFGESGIKCGISITVHNFSQQYIMRHNLIKKVFKRYQQEGIEIPFPTRNVLVKKES